MRKVLIFSILILFIFIGCEDQALIEVLKRDCAKLRAKIVVLKKEILELQAGKKSVKKPDLKQ